MYLCQLGLSWETYPQQDNSVSFIYRGTNYQRLGGYRAMGLLAAELLPFLNLREEAEVRVACRVTE